MYDYISKELPEVLSANLPIVCILGHIDWLRFRNHQWMDCCDQGNVISLTYRSPCLRLLFFSRHRISLVHRSLVTPWYLSN